MKLKFPETANSRFHLHDALLAIAIIAFLVAMLFPAVEQVREADRRERIHRIIQLSTPATGLTPPASTEQPNGK